MENINFLHGGDIYNYSQKLLDFSSNINPVAIPLKLKKLIVKNFDKIKQYPDNETMDLKKALAKYWGISQRNILVGNGSAELIYLLFFALKPKSVLIISPTFSEYEKATKNFGSKLQILDLNEKNNFNLSSNFFSTSDFTFFCNPNNPTGNIILEKKMLAALSGKYTIIDEAFMDFVENQKNYTLIKKAPQEKNLIVLRSFTKYFALAGIRLGYLVANEKLISKLNTFKIPWSVNCFGQILGEAILKEKDYFAKTEIIIKQERDFLYNSLWKFPTLYPYPSVTNFVLVKIKKENLSAKMLKDKLLKKGILIRDCSNFRNLNNKYFRVAVKLHLDNLKLISCLKEVI